MRQRYKAKITLPEEPWAEYCDIKTEQLLECLFCAAFSDIFDIFRDNKLAFMKSEDRSNIRYNQQEN